eukprot:365388-Chlamydomonas_euryale.AAC.4
MPWQCAWVVAESACRGDMRGLPLGHEHQRDGSERSALQPGFLETGVHVLTCDTHGQAGMAFGRHEQAGMAFGRHEQAGMAFGRHGI